MDTLDNIDIKILKLLQDNSQLSTKEIAAEVNLSTTPVYERIKRLQSDGYIKKYVALLDAEKLKIGFTVFCNVKITSHNYKVARDFVSQVMNIPEVLECYAIAGAFDYLIKIQAPDMAYYRRFMFEVLGRIESIGSITSMFVMNEVKHTHCLPLFFKKN